MKAVIGFLIGCVTLCIIPWFALWEIIKETNGSSCKKSKN